MGQLGLGPYFFIPFRSRPSRPFARSSNIPFRHGLYLRKEQCPSTQEEIQEMNRVPYASAIGSIMYAMLCTRPDVAHALSMTSRFQQNPGMEHWKAVKAILKYLRRTKGLMLTYGGQDSLVMTGYVDAAFQSDQNDLRSQTGYVFTLNGGAISWRSSKQDTTADSTTESEYIAACDAAKEGVWFRKFISDLGIIQSIQDPIEIYCDNNGAIAQAKEPRSHQKNKHILRKFHLIREIINRGDVKICKVDSNDNIADSLTKALVHQKLERHVIELGLKLFKQ